MAQIKETYVDYAGFKTYCKIVGEGSPGKNPCSSSTAVQAIAITTC